MLQPTKKIPTPDEILGENKIPTPQEILGDELKKKESTELDSTTPKTNLELAPKAGSLGTPKIKIKNERLDGVTKKDVTSLAKPRRVTTDISKLEKESEAFKQLANKKLSNYRQATKIPQEERQAVLDELKAKKEKEGVINNIKSRLKQGWNAFVDVIGVGGSKETKETWKIDADPFADEKKEAIEFFKEQKIKPTDLQIEQKADEIFIRDKTLQLKQDKINDYLGSLDEQEKTYLEVDAQKRFPTISKKRQDISNRISMNEKALAKALDDLKAPMTKEDRVLVEDEIDKISKYLDEDKKLFSKATDELGTAQEELDAFKRNYNKIENAKARAISSISEGAISFVEGLDYLGTLGGTIGSSKEVLKDTEKARQGMQEYKEQYRRDNKELTLDNFFQYSTDLLANQSGTLLTIAGAGSTGGASILGLGQAGQTYAEMRKANKKGENYAPWQMIVAPAVSGFSTGILSASPTFETLKNAKNVWKSALKDPLAKGVAENAIKKTSQSLAKQVYGDTKKEVVTELLDNTIQNAVKKDILGDKSVGYFDNSWQVLKDTALMTGLLNAGALPQVTMEGVRMFSKPENNKILNNNGQKIAKLLPQLDNENISETSQKAIKSEIDKATAENTQIINSTLDKISKLPDSDVKKVVGNNKKQGELTSEAEAIKEDNSIEIPAKKILLDAKKQEYEKIQESTNEIINAETQTPTTKPKVKSETKVQEQTEEQKVSTEPISDSTEPASVLSESQEIKINENAPSQNTPADGNVSIRVEPMAESGITKQESPAKESVQNTVDSGESKNDVEVDIKTPIEKAIEDKSGVYYLNGEQGEVKLDGQTVVFETKDKIIELGNKEDLTNSSVEDFDINHEKELDFKLNNDNSIEINGKKYVNNYSNPESAFSQDKNGNYSVSLETENGQKRTFRGQQADQIVYQTKLKNFEQNATEKQVERGHELADEIVKTETKTTKSSPKRENKSVRKAEPRKVTPKIKEVATVEEEKPNEVGNSKNDVPNEKTPSRKEKRIKAVEASIDDIANSAKSLEKIFGIKIKADFGDGKSQGVSREQLIDFIATTAKAIAKTGIEIDEAIRTVIDELKKSYEVDIEAKDVFDKHFAKEEVPADFERKQGKKSVAGRMASGNSTIIKKAIANNSLDYEIENQKIAKEKAEAFVEEVGFDNALIAVRDGLVDGGQGAFIYARAIEILEQEINNLKGEDKLDAIADYQNLLDEIAVELDLRSRKYGQFISALANIYYSSKGRYNLTKMVKDYKAENGGVISKEVLEKLKNVEEKLKVAEEKLAELEAKKRIEEENEAFNNIIEAVARKKRINSNAKITDKQKAKAFADKLLSYKISNRANLSAATPFSVAYDLAIDAAAKVIITTGIISDAIKAGVDSIRNAKLSKDEQEQALSDLFDLFDDSDVNTGQRGMMSISEEGVLRIPHSLVREKVENGVDNIDDLVAELMTDAQELFPDLDFTERQVRDIVTGYGKISNPTQDEIETQISIMKSLGKIASGLEDVKKGQRPLRSGQQRREPTVKERTEMKKLKALMRDLPLADADIKKAYKTALEAIKKRLSNEIEELDVQIANGEKRKGQKSVIEYDQEAKDLKAERDAKKALLDEMVGKPELTDEQKIERAEKTLQKRLDDLQQKINSNEIDYAKKPETVTSDKLEEMRKLKKEYEAQIQKMREDAGMAEARMIEIAKRSATKRLVALKERIANGDFERRKRKPTPTDAELNKIKSEIAEQKEILDKEMYKVDLKNRRIEQKAMDLLKDLLSIPKILSFTSDLSFIGIQNVTQIYKMGANSLINLAKTGKLKGTFRSAMAKTFKAMASPSFEQEFMQSVKANPNYQLWKDSKLGIVESHYKESAKAEVFQHNAISMAFDILANYIALKGYEKTANIIKNYVNVISIFERGQTVFENIMRINRFQEGVDLLKAQGLNPIEDIQEYRKVAAAVNTLTGRANTGSKVASALREMNGTIFSSFSNWAAGVNQLNPYWYYTLTPTARKMALTDVAHHIVGAGSMISMAALYALGQDDDDEDKVKVEISPTSSDFAIIRVGNLRIDPWAGKKTTVVAFSRLVNGGKTDKYGNFKKYGIEYEDEDWIDLPLEYAGNKIAPGPRFFLDRFFKTKEVEYKGTSFREDKYGVDFKKSKYLIPLIFENFREVNEEQPNLFGKATMALSWTGLINTNVYGGIKEGFKDMPDDFLEKEYKEKIQKVKDNEKILEFNINKLTKDYVDKKINKFQVMQKVNSLVDGDVEMYNKAITSVIEKVDKEELKTLVTDPFYLGLKKEKNPEIQAILFYGKFKDDKGMSDKDKKERDKNLRYVEFDITPKFMKAYRELKKEKSPK
jgi:hypothetical protein